MMTEQEAEILAREKGKCGFATMGGLMDDGTHYAYTIGLAERGLMELIVVGPSVVMCGAIAHAAGHRLIDKGLPAEGEIFDMQGNTFAIKKAMQPEMVKDMAPYAFENNATLRPEQFAQLVIADPAGLMPWQDGFDADIAHHQELLWKQGAPAGVMLH